MPQMPQVVVSDGKGRGRRLMVRAKKGARHEKINVAIYDGDLPNPRGPMYSRGGWTTKNVSIDGMFRGTRKVPKGNAVKHPITGNPQTTELLVQIYSQLAALPVSEAELYWQKGDIKPGMRFVPDKADAVTAAADPQPAQPKP